ncbi:hypothetical protein F4780DRAFT_564735 [Xylariomycetidae sp. FL0641]|nr:hypothetical protein F4780DRAFT_564735 [Xylariomycetidae sp. FL0641]
MKPDPQGPKQMAGIQEHPAVKSDALLKDVQPQEAPFERFDEDKQPEVIEISSDEDTDLDDIEDDHDTDIQDAKDKQPEVIEISSDEDSDLDAIEDDHDTDIRNAEGGQDSHEATGSSKQGAIGKPAKAPFRRSPYLLRRSCKDLRPAGVYHSGRYPHEVVMNPSDEESMGEASDVPGNETSDGGDSDTEIIERRTRPRQIPTDIAVSLSSKGKKTKLPESAKAQSRSKEAEEDESMNVADDESMADDKSTADVQTAQPRNNPALAKKTGRTPLPCRRPSKSSVDSNEPLIPQIAAMRLEAKKLSRRATAEFPARVRSDSLSSSGTQSTAAETSITETPITSAGRQTPWMTILSETVTVQDRQTVRPVGYRCGHCERVWNTANAFYYHRFSSLTPCNLRAGSDPNVNGEVHCYKCGRGYRSMSGLEIHLFGGLTSCNPNNGPPKATGHQTTSSASSDRSAAARPTTSPKFTPGASAPRVPDDAQGRRVVMPSTSSTPAPVSSSQSAPVYPPSQRPAQRLISPAMSLRSSATVSSSGSSPDRPLPISYHQGVPVISLGTRRAYKRKRRSNITLPSPRQWFGPQPPARPVPEALRKKPAAGPTGPAKSPAFDIGPTLLPNAQERRNFRRWAKERRRRLPSKREAKVPPCSQLLGEVDGATTLCLLSSSGQLPSPGSRAREAEAGKAVQRPLPEKNVSPAAVPQPGPQRTGVKDHNAPVNNSSAAMMAQAALQYLVPANYNHAEVAPQYGPPRARNVVQTTDTASRPISGSNYHPGHVPQPGQQGFFMPVVKTTSNGQLNGQPVPFYPHHAGAVQSQHRSTAPARQSPGSGSISVGSQMDPVYHNSFRPVNADRQRKLGHSMKSS